MRIIAGQFRRTRLMLPPPHRTRPTRDAVKESLFNMMESLFLRHDCSFQGASVLDAFAGSGALGLEALSRGATAIFFCEPDGVVRACLEENIRRLKGEGSCRIYARRLAQIPRAQQPCDIIFLDPPYAQGHLVSALSTLFHQGWVGANTWIVIELSLEEAFEVPAWAELESERGFGISRILILKTLQGAAAPEVFKA